jgi:GNAT superfamily N-acetyltransferase
MAMNIARLQDLVKDLGLLTALLYACARVVKLLTGNDLVRSYVFTVQAVTELPSNRRSSQRSIRVERISRAGYQVHWFPRPASVIADRYQQQAICFAAFKGDEAVGCLWLAPGEYVEDEVACRFVPEPAQLAAWDFDVYVKPEHRGGRVFAYLWDEALVWLRGNGYRWTMSRIDGFNSASVRAHRRLGARVVGRGTFFVAGKLQISMFTVRPFVHLCWGRRHPPRVRVSAT